MPVLVGKIVETAKRVQQRKTITITPQHLPGLRQEDIEELRCAAYARTRPRQKMAEQANAVSI